MISKIKKPVSILLVFMMIVSLFAVVPITASAAEETITLTSGTDKLKDHGITHIGDNSGSHLDFSGNELYHGTFVAPPGKVFTKIVTNDAGRGAMNWTGSADQVHHGNIEGQWYEYYNDDDEQIAYYLPFTISFTLADAITTYTVTWKNGETTLKTDTVDKDAIPAYDGNTPTWPEDENYTYTFSGWTNGTNTYGKDETLPAVTANVIYTATFAREDKAVKNVIALINALPAAAEITAADKAQIESARAAYDALNGDQKTLVTNETLDKLTAAETALAAAENLFPQHSVTLGGDIGVNFFINSKTADFASDENAYVKFTWDNGTYTKEVKLKDLPRDNNGNYKATVDVVAAQMAHKIHAEVYVGDDKIGEEYYSVQDYAEEVYNHPDAYDKKGKPRELQELAKALLNYGAQAQIVFDEYLVEKPAPANTVKTVGQTDFSGITAEQIKAAVNGETSDLKEVAEQLDAEFYTSSLIYLSRNTLRLYFTPASKTVGALDGKGFSGNLSEYYYFKDVENIPAAELDDQQTFTVGGTTFTFSALDYAAAVVNSDNMKPEQQNLAKALYLYNKAANDYFDVKEPSVADALKNDSTVQVKVRVTSNGNWWRTKTWQYNNGTFNQTADAKGTSGVLDCSLSASGDIITLRINYNNNSRTVTINTATNTYTETTSGNATWVSRLVWDNFIVNGTDMKPTLTKG